MSDNQSPPTVTGGLASATDYVYLGGVPGDGVRVTQTYPRAY